MVVLEGLIRNMLRRYILPAEAVIAHSDLAPGRKGDPGARFDWARLARQGLAAPVDLEPVDPVQSEAVPRNKGYTADAPPEELWAAFELRHGAWRR